jgi:TolB-like protein
MGIIGLAVLICSLLVWSTASSPSQPLRIVTLPSPDAQSVEFADGLAEALSAELAQNPALEVIAWPVVTAYRRQAGAMEPTPEDTARSLGAEVVLLVSARQSGDRRRVIAHLIRPISGQKEWARDYERGTADPFAVQRELSRVIAEEVRTVAARIAVDRH